MTGIAMKNKKFAIIKMTTAMLCLFFLNNSQGIEFNTDVIDSSDRENIDFSRFSQAGYILPGEYQLQIVVNGQNVLASETAISFIDVRGRDGESQPQACLTPEIVAHIGLTEAAHSKVTWWESNSCADLGPLAGATVQADLAAGTLNINLPRALLEYSDASWLPPSRWENGIPGLLFDYNLNGNLTRPDEGGQTQSLSYNGTIGANIEAWRLRGDYQGSLSRTEGSASGTRRQADWTRFYLYRALPQLQSKLTLGENYINSDIFSSWSYTGVSLDSDDRMLPPRLRGYAPQITGIAETNARVIVTQQGRVLYDSTVPAGPFSIQDLDSAIRGRLDVEVIESSGQRKTFNVDTAYVPYLTRPGQVRYKLVGGRSRYTGHEMEGPVFSGGELSWGVDNNWSLYGGGIFSGAYNALAMGIGRDLYEWGALSTDVTQSVARPDGRGTQTGKSWRLSYSKRFDEVNTDITFAGYRFSERNYMTMQGYLDARYREERAGRDKELYTISLNKYFSARRISLNLQYSHQRFWDAGASNYYTLSANQYFDALGLKNLSVGVTASRTKYSGRYNDAAFLRLSVPLGNGMLSYNGSMNDSRFTQTVGYSDTLNDGMDGYNINAGVNHGHSEGRGGQLNGYYSRHSSLADLSASFSAVQNSYSSLGLSASGGATLTAKGAALHAGGMNGGTRMLVSTDGIGGVPVDGGRVFTNMWGSGVVTDISSYYRNTVSVDINRLPEDIEAPQSVVESALTEGAIGYRKFSVLKGARLFAVLRTADNGHPPFGAAVLNARGRESGMVGDDGLVWLSGVNPGETLSVSWDGKVQCRSDIPADLHTSQQLLLPCQSAR